MEAAQRAHLSVDGDLRAPSAVFEYMLYQALLGAWQPAATPRLRSNAEYALKAARGASETAGSISRTPYEGASRASSRNSRSFALRRILNALQTLAQRLSLLGALVAQPDHAEGNDAGCAGFYQGTELWDFSLVDPDSGGRSTLPARTCSARWRNRIGTGWSRKWPSGHLKLAWTRHLLRLRTELADVSQKAITTFGSERAPSRPFHRSPGAQVARPRSRRHVGLRR
jgi:(1->4)-alpha-D-glucan 1-alpha-D-glucosylmutase